jgi:tRNA(adenine34) deaminase
VQENDEYWMALAIAAANEAAAREEVPVGACIVGPDNELLASASNLTITSSDPTAHAEILALRKAAERLGNYRLTETTLYTTIEPCVMCAGAIVNARVRRLVFGAHDPRYGAVESVFQLCDSSLLNHRLEITAGVLGKECSRLMKQFFVNKRTSAGAETQTES